MQKNIRVIWIGMLVIAACNQQAMEPGLKSSEHKKKQCIMLSDLGGDVDDVLTIAYALGSDNPPLAIIATHHHPFQKAQIAKLIANQLGYPNIPVFAGHGLTTQDSREEFAKMNSLWPPFFGYLNPQTSERLWNATQAQAYKEVFGNQFDELRTQISQNSQEFVKQKVNELKAGEKLDIVALSPLHELYFLLKNIRKEKGEKAEREFAQKIKLWSMGGNYPQGYNWLISPETTSYVLDRIETTVISSALVRKSGKIGISVATKEFDVLSKIPTTSLIAKAILKDWKNWNKDDQLKNEKNMGDPLTLYLYLHPDQIAKEYSAKVEFPCLTEQGVLKEELKGAWYCKKDMENAFITITQDPKSHIRFIEELKDPEMIRRTLIYHIAKIFVPSLNEKNFFEAMYDEKLSAKEIADRLAAKPEAKD